MSEKRRLGGVEHGHHRTAACRASEQEETRTQAESLWMTKRRGRASSKGINRFDHENIDKRTWPPEVAWCDCHPARNRSEKGCYLSADVISEEVDAEGCRPKNVERGVEKRAERRDQGHEKAREMRQNAMCTSSVENQRSCQEDRRKEDA